MLKYQAILLEAIEQFVQVYETGSIRLITEADLQGHLFFHCLRLLQEHQADRPYQLHCNLSVLSDRERVDLTLGDNEVVVALRLEPNYPGLLPSQKPHVFSQDIEHDFEQIRGYCERGILHGYTILLDEDGCHLRAFPTVPWRKISNSRHEAYLLVRHFQAHSSGSGA